MLWHRAVISEETTLILIASAKGTRQATDALVARIYDELKSAARRRLSRESPGHPFCPTDLVHETYARLVDQDQVDWKGRTHFLAIAGQMMGRVLIDEHRKQAAKKRGGSAKQITWTSAEQAIAGHASVELGPLVEALEKLEQMNDRHGKLAKLKLFTPLKEAEIAAELGISLRTVWKDWKFIEAWLKKTLTE